MVSIYIIIITILKSILDMLSNIKMILIFKGNFKDLLALIWEEEMEINEKNNFRILFASLVWLF